MAVHASHAALPYPIKNARFSMLVPFLDADGDPTAQTTPDTEISEDNAAATDAAEETSATSGMDGMALITFTSDETDCTTLAVNFKAASGPKATLATLYPRVLASVGTGTLSAGSAGGGTLGTLLTYDVTGCFIKTTGGTGGGSGGNQARKIVTYNTGTGAFTVTPNWETTPDATTTYDVLLPEGVTLGMLKTLNPATAGRTLVVDASGLADANTVKLGPTGSGTAQTARDIGASVLLSSGTGTGQVKLSSGYVAPNWGDVGNPTTTVGLSGTTIKTATDVETDTADIQGRLPAALVSGKMDSDATSISGDSAAADNLEKYFDGTGYGDLLQRTTIATLASQTSFTLTAGSADNDAYNGCVIVFEDASTAAQKAVGVISDYTGATKTVTMLNDPAVYTIATTDIVSIYACRALKPETDNRLLDVSAGGDTRLQSSGLDLVLIESSISASASLTDDAASQLTSINARQALSLIVSAAAAGVLAGAATTSVTIKPAGLPAGNTRITATVDADGNRSALVLKVPT